MTLRSKQAKQTTLQYAPETQIELNLPRAPVKPTVTSKVDRSAKYLSVTLGAATLVVAMSAGIA